VDWAFCGRHTNANVGNIRKSVKEGIHFVYEILADLLPSGNQRHPSAILRSGKRFVLRADEKLTAFLELESQGDSGCSAKRRPAFEITAGLSRFFR
jgi:hypothetical protein